jgi:hypothetical protein
MGCPIAPLEPPSHDSSFEMKRDAARRRRHAGDTPDFAWSSKTGVSEHKQGARVRMRVHESRIGSMWNVLGP